MRLVRKFYFAVLMMTLAGTLAQAQKPSGYKVSRRITLGGEGGWDYLTFDGEAHRLYITRATRVMVVDVDGGKLVGEIPNTLGVHGVALVHKLGRGVTSNGKADSATIFDLKTLAPIATVKTGAKPDSILFDNFSGLVMTFNGKSNDVTLIDPEKAVAVGTIALPGRPETGVSDGKGKVFVNLEDKNMIAEIDVAARKRAGELAAGRMRGTDGTGNGHRQPPPVLRLPQWNAGGDRCGLGPDCAEACDRQRRGCRRVRQETAGWSLPPMAKAAFL